MSYKPVTVSQMECGRKIANEKKLGSERFQKGLDDGSFGRYLDLLKSDEILPTPGTRIHTLRAKVKLDQPWQEAIDVVGATPSDYNIRKVGDLYTPTGTGEEDREYILLNYPNGDGTWDQALAWAEGKGLTKTVPREVFAVSTQHPVLHNTLGFNPMYVVATTECSFEGYQQACYVWWRGSDRGADLGWVSGFVGGDGWFLFRKPSASAT